MRKAVLFLFFFPLVILSKPVFAQSGTVVFDDNILHRIDIRIEPITWFDILETDYKQNSKDSVKYPEIYRSCNIWFDGAEILNSGIREKGNSSNTFLADGKKKPFKIAFDAFTDNSFDGLKKLNLNNFTNDPSLMHEAIAYKMFRDSKVIAGRTSYAKVYFNDKYWGLYLLVENVDKTFLKSKFGSANNNGNLYKTDRGAQVNLDWLGYDMKAYQEEGLKQTNNEDSKDWSKFFHFVEVLNLTSDENFPQELEKVFDVHSYLKILAIEKCMRSWDNYSGGGNNFYLYEHPDGMIRWIPWDENESFQSMKLLSKTHLLDGYLVPTKNSDKRPLIRRIFEVEGWRNEYLQNVCEFLQNYYCIDSVGPYALKMHALIAEAYKEDQNKFNSFEEFDKSLNEDHQDVVSVLQSPYALHFTYPGIFPFIVSQRQWAKDQMKEWNFSCSCDNGQSYPITFYPNPALETVHFDQAIAGFDYSEILFYNTLGQLVKQVPFQNFTGISFDLNLSSLKPGFYFVIKRGANGDKGFGKLIVN